MGRRALVITRLPPSLLLGAACALAACGFLGEEPFPGRRRPEVAPWSDLGPVVLCDGARRLGPPASKPAGFCAVDETAPPCAADADCKSRERCTCGGCRVAACSSGDECSGGFVCTFSDARCDRPCAKDSDCAAGEICLPGEGVCRGACASAADCQRGESCDDGRCATRPCAGDAGCGGLRCVLDRVPGDVREPMPLPGAAGAPEEERVVLWVERVEAGRAAVWRAVSRDGRRFRFAPSAPVLVPQSDDMMRAGAPALLALPSGGYLAAYADGRGRLRRATTPDGITFTVDPTPLLVPSQPWEQPGLDAPALVPSPAASPTGVLVYYATSDRSAVGLAHSPSSDGSARFTARPAPVLLPAALADPVLFRDVDRVASPFAETVIPPGGASGGAPALRLWLAARGRPSAPSMQFGMPAASPPEFSLTLAATTDGATLVPWPFPPVFDRIQTFLTHLAELEPAVVALGDRRLLYYRGAAGDETRSTNLGVAESPAPQPNE